MTPGACLDCRRQIPTADVPFALQRGQAGFVCAHCRGTRLPIAGVRLGRCISEARHCSTFEAVRDPDTQCRVSVVRSFGPIRSDDLERDARSAASLKHPGLLRLLGFGQTGELVWWAEEAFPNATPLSKLLGNTLEPRWSAEVIAQLAGSLELLAPPATVELDPSTIYVEPRSGPKVSAFSAVPYVEREGRNWARAGEGRSMGALPYMAPERIDNATNVDVRTVVYLLGAILYHMLAGRKPFIAHSNMDFFMKILNETPEKIEAHVAPPPLVAVVERCLEKRPEARFSSLKELAAELRAAGR